MAQSGFTVNLIGFRVILFSEPRKAKGEKRPGICGRVASRKIVVSGEDPQFVRKLSSMFLLRNPGATHGVIM